MTPVIGFVRGVLLAAGRGTRLLPLTNLVPKPALPLLDVPLGGFSLADLISAGPVVVNLSHLAGAAAAALAPYGDAKTTFLHETPEPYGGAGTVAALKDRLAERFVTRNADLLSDLAASELLSAHERAGAAMTIAVRMVTRGADLEIADGRLVRVIARGREADSPGALWLGAAVVERAALDLIGSHRPLDLAHGLLAPLIRRDGVAMHVHEGYALDVGTPARYLRATLDLLDGRGPEPPKGWPGEIVTVASGRAYVGPGADVARASLGPGAVVLAGARVGAGARIERALVWPGELVDRDAVLTDVVWAAGRPWPLFPTGRSARPAP